MANVPLHAVVAVPARNEEARLPKLIAALARQTYRSPDGLPLEVIVVLNNCTDGSAAALADAALRHQTLRLTVIDVDLPPAEAHVGTARRLAMEAASARADDDAVILTTDADATPPADWVAENLAAIAAGADLVGGRIVGDPEEEAALGPEFVARARAFARYQALCDELASRLDPLPHDPWPRHHDHTGASLAVRADVYRCIGGLPPEPYREDLALVTKARSQGYLLRHAPAVSVTVSARTDGRAKGGMADCIRTWRNEAVAQAPLLVQDPAVVEARLWRRASLRAAVGAEPELAAAGAIIVAALIERFASEEPDAPATVPVDVAIAEMEARLGHLEDDRDAA